MKRVIFRNIRPYMVQVPVPAGYSKQVPPGSYVEGDYYIGLNAVTGDFLRMPENYQVDRKYLVCSVYTGPVDSAPEVVLDGTEVSIPTPEPVVLAVPTPLPPTTFRTIAESMQEVSRQLGQSYPSAVEIENMKVEGLRQLAGKVGMTYFNPKRHFIEALKARIAELR